jgi:hypothetical protein
MGYYRNYDAAPYVEEDPSASDPIMKARSKGEEGTARALEGWYLYALAESRK